MRSNEFRAWMEAMGTMSKRPISDAVSRCKRVENCLKIDLDDEYKKDCGLSLLNQLIYTYEDMNCGKPVPQGLDFKPAVTIRRVWIHCAVQ